MNKKAIIFDLDNTIYSVRSIGNKLFGSLFDLIIQDGNHQDNLEKIKDEIMRRPFQQVAKNFGFSEQLTQRGTALLQGLEYMGQIEPFEDYHYVKNFRVDKYLVTTGFVKLQGSKIDGMRIREDFIEIHIIDPATSGKTKKDVFDDITRRHGYNVSEIVVVGDDPQSEIKAARELDIEAVLFDKFNRYPDVQSVPRISNFKELAELLTQG